MQASSDLDGELMRRLAGGDREALGRLYDRHAAVLIAVAERILRSRREAEDVAHDVFLEAWRQAEDYQPGRGSVRSWLVLRARCRAIDRVRQAEVRHLAADEEIDVVADPGAEDGAVSSDCAVVRREVAALPSEQREVLLLAYFEGLSMSEIAERIAIPLGTVKSRMAAALAKLRTSLVEVSG